jgi:hypothetical protein
MYPSISDALATSLTVVAKGLEADLGYLDKPTCPYGPALKAALRSFRGGSGPAVDIFAQNVGELDVIEREIKELINKIKVFGDEMGNLEPNEKIQFFKASTGLLEKLISYKERTLNLKKMKEFQALVIDVMSDVLTGDERTEVLKRLSNGVS